MAICTIVAKNYLPLARTLMSSIQRTHPEWARIVILVDAVDGFFDPSTENFDLILSTELDLPDSKWFHFKYSILELSTAVKPYALRRLTQEQGLDAVVYLDPDIQLYNRMDPVKFALKDADIVLTPHLTSPIMDSKRPGELDILRSGVYNLGFIALASRPAAISFLDWWCEKLRDNCTIAPEKELFLDQRWCDLVPGLFENVRVLREPGLNVAYWNVHARRVELRGGQLVVNGRPLYFFHFSGFEPDHPAQFSRYQDRFQLADIPVVNNITQRYRETLLQNGYNECTGWPYRFGFFADGTPIPDLLRPVLRENARLAVEFDDPFSAAGRKRICDTWNEPLPDPAGPPFFTRLALRIYALRAELRAAFPDIYGHDRENYLRWLESSVTREYGTPDEVSAAFRTALPDYDEVNPSAGAAQTSHGAPAGIEIDSNERSRLRMHALNHFIHGSRPDLRRAFPDPLGRDRLAYLTWLCTYGRVEYPIEPDLIASIQREWELAVKAKHSDFQALWQRLRRTAYAIAAGISARRQARHSPARRP